MSNQSPTPASPKKPTEVPSAIEFDPPLACIKRILKNTLPESTNVGKDASVAFARACGIFIIYLTACANDFAREGKRQTITANDVLAAMKELDFEEFTPDMTSFLENYRQAERDKKNAKAAAAAAKQARTTEGITGAPTATDTQKRPRDEEEPTEHDEASDPGSVAEEPESKRTKVESEEPSEDGEANATVENEESQSTCPQSSAGPKKQRKAALERERRKHQPKSIDLSVNVRPTVISHRAMAPERIAKEWECRSDPAENQKVLDASWTILSSWLSTTLMNNRRDRPDVVTPQRNCEALLALTSSS